MKGGFILIGVGDKVIRLWSAQTNKYMDEFYVPTGSSLADDDFDENKDKDLGMYNPAESSTSCHLPCSHELCQLGSSCKVDKQPCPYNISYYT
ncbi:aspartic proteinase-like protein 1 isoform X1 [Carex littledalei]|uniref:Aspartic proteinase-like protein 1 isoform X1 n=1 Tax=Carex littledalei TaxID=544730 RepID=A0A833R0T2_9POAL|nr:aspartic proteinase-like protein 1 isoform X1 [Carex littledalei]